MRKDAVICILHIPLSSPCTWIPSKAFLIYFVTENARRIRGFLPCTSFFFSFTASGCYVVFIKAKLCSFSFKISLQRAQHVQFALVLITHRCFTLKLQAARRNTDKICYDEGTMVLSTRISSLSALSSCLGTFKASGRLILIE